MIYLRLTTYIDVIGELNWCVSACDIEKPAEQFLLDRDPTITEMTVLALNMYTATVTLFVIVTIVPNFLFSNDRSGIETQPSKYENQRQTYTSCDVNL